MPYVNIVLYEPFEPSGYPLPGIKVLPCLWVCRSQHAISRGHEDNNKTTEGFTAATQQLTPRNYTTRLCALNATGVP